MTGDMRNDAVTRAAAKIMKVRAPLVTMAVAVFLFCLSMSPWKEKPYSMMTIKKIGIRIDLIYGERLHHPAGGSAIHLW